jgi:hypothetical protein
MNAIKEWKLARDCDYPAFISPRLSRKVSARQLGERAARHRS